jgi:formylmethanofuran dehydrogenase subunit E
MTKLRTEPRRNRNNTNTNDLSSEYFSRQSSDFKELLAESEVVHGHICPGQVLGVRMAIRGCRELGIEKPKEEPKRMIVYVEIDRCATDAIQVVIGCKLGKRTMKYADYGKLAATFVDLMTGKAVRVVVREDSREKAARYTLEGWTKQDGEIAAYKALPDEELFNVEEVFVEIPEEDMPGPPKRRVLCDQCGEGVNDSRDVLLDGKIVCRACAYGTYYKSYNAVADLR